MHTTTTTTTTTLTWQRDRTDAGETIHRATLPDGTIVVAERSGRGWRVRSGSMYGGDLVVHATASTLAAAKARVEEAEEVQWWKREVVLGDARLLGVALGRNRSSDGVDPVAYDHAVARIVSALDLPADAAEAFAASYDGNSAEVVR